MLSAQEVKGKITNSKGEVLPFVSVLSEDGVSGSFSDVRGFYSIKLANGEHGLTFSFLGYKDVYRTVNLRKGEIITLDIELTLSSVSLEEAEVVSNTRDRAKEIMKLVRQNRSEHLDSLSDFSLNLYQRISLSDEISRPNHKDTLEFHRFEAGDSLSENPFIDRFIEMKEVNSILYFQAPSKYEEHISGIQLYEEGEFPEDDDIEKDVSVGASVDLGPNVIVPQFQRSDAPWVLFEGADCFSINLYRTLLSIDQVADKPVLSPLAATSALTYKFDYEGTEFFLGEKTYLIKVTPLNSLENLFKGLIWFSADDYSIRQFKLELVGAKKYCKAIDFTYSYGSDEFRYVPKQVYIEHSTKVGRRDDVVRVECAIDSVSLEPDFSEVKFGVEYKKIDPLAYDRDAKFWSEKRILELDSSKKVFIQKSDSLEAYYESPEYLHKVDSAFNRINIWAPLIGVGHRNRAKGNEWYVEGLLGQINPFGIGGYRHMLPGYFNKDVNDDFSVRVQGHVDYGFANKDIKGKGTLGFTYNTRKFVRTQVTFGDFYDMINDYASLEQTFSRSNYVRTIMAGASQRMEIINGLYAELTFEFQDQLPLDNFEFADWREFETEELNEPIIFERYLKSEIRLQAQYRFKQEYYFRGNRKMVTPSKYPEITLLYRKGIPDLFNSEVNFDFLELGAFQEIELGRFGSSRWNFEFGTFLNKKNLRSLEYKFFRGSDAFLFSDPLRSFQALGPTLNTPNEYIRINGIHHFEGTILNKIPLIRRLKMGVAVGAGSLAIPDSDFYHAEFFAGLEKSFMLFREPVRMGIYAVNGAATIDSPDLTYKVGFTFYDNFTRKWGY